MVQKMSIDGRVAWLKTYGRKSWVRAAMNWLWNRIVRVWQVGPLASPPRHADERAKQLESDRIRQLLACDLRVPEIIAEDRCSLLLCDIGSKFSRQLKAAGTVVQLDILTTLAIRELAAAHAKGAYFGQPFPRNMTFRDDRIGFIDFEDDPLEIMSLRDAQARDWLLFAAGIGRFYQHRETALASLFEAALTKLPDVRSEIARVVARLAPLEKFFHLMGRSASAYAVALLALRLATAA